MAALSEAISLDLTRCAEFSRWIHPRYRSVNHSPLEAASHPSQTRCDSFYECARRKSRINSRTAQRKL